MAENSSFGNDALFNSEYDDVLTLTGLDSVEQQEALLGQIMRNPAQRRLFTTQIFKPKLTPAPAAVAPAGQTTSRDDFQRRFKQLPADTRKGLLNKQKQLVDTALYVVKDISDSKIIKMLQDDDNKQVGRSNISGGKLEKGNFFTLKGIQLLYGVAGEGEDFKEVNYGILPDFIRNGEFEFTANGAILIPSMSCEVFNTSGMTRHRQGYFELVNPKMIETQQPMAFEVEWATNAPERTWMKLVLVGTSVAKY
ncbi:MAG: hypothetical protein KKA07_07660 [Bacteroidetes bacterium]|nr:hypothetical protein [Bacteroidota bacterium]